MRKLTLILLTCPFVFYAQEKESSLSLTGGLNYNSPQLKGWNLDLNYGRQIKPESKWSYELGLNFSVHDYLGDEEREIDSVEYLFPSGANILPPGYVRRTHVDYRKVSDLRIQAGFDYLILDRNKIRLSAGINFVSRLMTSFYEEGTEYYVPAMNDTLPFIANDYMYDRVAESDFDVVSVELQPHVDFSFKLSEHIWLTSRYAVYARMYYGIGFITGQLNAGVKYYF